MKMYDTPQELSKYLNIKLECDCGRTHYVPIKGVEIGADAIERLPHYVKSLGYAHPLVLCDEITYNRWRALHGAYADGWHRRGRAYVNAPWL